MDAGTKAQASEQAPYVILGFDTALLFWRAVREGRLPMPQQAETDDLPSRCITGANDMPKNELDQLGIIFTNQGVASRYATKPVTWGSRTSSGTSWRPTPLGIGLYPGVFKPLHVLARKRSQRHRQAAIKVHLVSSKLPAGSLFRISDHVMVVSPELTFVQCCCGRTELANIELAHELCGCFGLMTAELPCHFDLKALTSVDKLKDYALACLGRWESGAAIRALEWAVDGIRSPRESEVYLLLSLDMDVGGYGLPRPSVNVTIPLQDTVAQAFTNASHFEVDLVWEDECVVLEYDGYEEHEADAAKVAADKERRNILAALGYTVIVVTKRDFASEASFRAKVLQVGMALGTGIRSFSSLQAQAHTTLFNWLANPHHDHHPLGCGYH